MKKILLFTGLAAYLTLAQAIGFGVGHPGDVVNGSWGAGAGLSPEKELKDQLLTVPIWITIDNQTRKCTGTLIGNRSILTAKHCVAGFLSRHERNFMDVPIFANLENKIEVIVYSPAALLPENQARYGKVYKFWIDRNIYTEFTRYSDLNKSDNLVPSETYERIPVSNINSLRIKTDMVLLTLSMVPQIIAQGIVHPLTDIRFITYRDFFIDAIKKHSLKDYLDDIKTTQQRSQAIEMIGFGGAWTDKYLTDQQKQKIGFNLRTSLPSIPIFLPYPTNSNPADLCQNHCFIYSFVNQSSDYGDSGGAVSYSQDRNVWIKN